MRVGQMARSIRDTCSLYSRPVGLCRQAREKCSLDSAKNSGGDRRSEEKFMATLVPNVEARAVTVSPVSQETSVMLEEVLLTASTSAFAGERQASSRGQVMARSQLWQTTKVLTATSILISTSVSPARTRKVQLEKKHGKRRC